MADRPSPNSVSANPVATWFERKYWVRTANTRDIVAPPNAAHTKPIIGEPVRTAAANPQIAPVIIIPSTPKFRTPDFSTTNSPIEASNIGVDATMSEATSSVGLMADRSITKFLISYLVGRLL
ncbi:Uncharacterised protein [marine metagenome]